MASAYIDGLDDLQRRLASMAQVGSRNTMQALGEAFVTAAREAAPVDQTSEPPKHPGALRDSIHVLYAAPRAVGIGAGGPSAPYAASQEFGARPHQIYPSRAKRLRFFWVREGRMFYGAKGQPVSHPGNAPQPFFFPTLREFGAMGLGAYFRTEATKTISMIDAIRVDLVNHWNAGA